MIKQKNRLRTYIFLLITALGGNSIAYGAERDETIFFHTDALGSAVAAVNEDGDLCWSEKYTPYGDKTINADLVPDISNCGLLGEERGFTGHTEDVATDLVYMKKRFFDPSLGQFLSIDSSAAIASDTRSLNRYSYAVNNPLRYVDPTGADIEVAQDYCPGGCNTIPASHPVFKTENHSMMIPIPGVGTSIVPVGTNEVMNDLFDVLTPGVAGKIKAVDKLIQKSIEKYGIQSYKELRKLVAGQGKEVHHLLEKRFRELFGEKAGDMASVVLDPKTHQEITNAWRKAIPYGEGTTTATRESVLERARDI